ncbi:uncharacterized protein VP01_11981g1, partial [Puccinia sorghi]
MLLNHIHPYLQLPPSHPADELTKFAETTLKGKPAVFFAAEQSIFAKHITKYLTSWNVDVSHMPYEKSEHDTSNPRLPLLKFLPKLGQVTQRKVVGQSASSMSASMLVTEPFDLLLKLKASPASSLHLPANVLSHQPSQRPLMS